MALSNKVVFPRSKAQHASSLAGMQSEPVVKPYRDLPNGDGGEIQEGVMLHSLKQHPTVNSR